MATSSSSKRLPLISHPSPTEAMVAYCKEIGIQVPHQIEPGYFSKQLNGALLKVAPANHTLPTACSIDFHEGYVLMLLPKADLYSIRGPSISGGVEKVWFIGLTAGTNAFPRFVVGRVEVGVCQPILDGRLGELLVAFEKDPYESMNLTLSMDGESNLDTLEPPCIYGFRKCPTLPPASLSFCEKCSSSKSDPKAIKPHIEPSSLPAPLPTTLFAPVEASGSVSNSHTSLNLGNVESCYLYGPQKEAWIFHKGRLQITNAEVDSVTLWSFSERRNDAYVFFSNDGTGRRILVEIKPISGNRQLWDAAMYAPDFHGKPTINGEWRLFR